MLENVAEIPVEPHRHGARFFKKYGPRAGGSLIQGKDVFHKNIRLGMRELLGKIKEKATKRRTQSHLKFRQLWDQKQESKRIPNPIHLCPK